MVSFLGEVVEIAAADLRADSLHRTDEVFDHAVGIGMIDVEAVQFAVGRQIDSGLPLQTEDDASGILRACSLGNAASQSGTG